MVLDWRCHFIRLHMQAEPEKTARDINLLRFPSESRLHVATSAASVYGWARIVSPPSTINCVPVTHSD